MVAVERTQTGVRIETRMLKVLKALAEYLDMSLGDLIEGIVLHAFDGRLPFGAGDVARRSSSSRRSTVSELTADDAHRLDDRSDGEP